VAGGIAVAALLLGAGIAFLALRKSSSAAAFDSARTQDEIRQAESRGQDLIGKARRDAEQIARDAGLRSRDGAVPRREEVSRELEQQRNEMRELERRIEKREDAAEQQHKELVRKEKEHEAHRRKLHERNEQLEKKEKRLDELIVEETKKL